MHVISNEGRILFSGTRHDCKQFIRKNNVKQYKLKERFTEKVIETTPVFVEPDEEFIDLDDFLNE